MATLTLNNVPDDVLRDLIAVARNRNVPLETEAVERLAVRQSHVEPKPRSSQETEELAREAEVMRRQIRALTDDDLIRRARDEWQQ